MDPSLQSRLEPLFYIAFAIAAVLWLTTSALIVVNRLLHDRRQRRLESVSRSLMDPAVVSLPPLQRSRSLRRRLARLPRRAVYRMVADPELPDGVVEICAAHLLERVGVERMMRDAAPKSTRGRKWRRIPALLALARLRTDRVHEVLRTALADDDLDIASAAATALHRLGDGPAASILISSLGRVALPASRIATHLDEFPIPVADALRPLLADPSPEVRYWAVSLLMRYPDSTPWRSAITSLADDPHPPVRKAAMLTLGAVAPESAVVAAERNLTHAVPFVRSTAVRVLAQVAAKASDVARRQTAAKLVEALADIDWSVRATAKEGLIRLGPTVWRQVAAGLESQDAFARNGAAEVLQDLGILDWAARRVGRGEPVGGASALVKRVLEEGGGTMSDALSLRSARAIAEHADDSSFLELEEVTT
jgi:HEAT repeat protein